MTLMELAKRIGEDIDSLKDIFLNIGVLPKIPIQHSGPFHKLPSMCHFVFSIVCVALEVPNVLKPQCSMKWYSKLKLLPCCNVVLEKTVEVSTIATWLWQY